MIFVNGSTTVVCDAACWQSAADRLASSIPLVMVGVPGSGQHRFGSRAFGLATAYKNEIPKGLHVY